jgi:PHD finger-like domain-containing protein 5A
LISNHFYVQAQTTECNTIDHPLHFNTFHSYSLSQTPDQAVRYSIPSKISKCHAITRKPPSQPAISWSRNHELTRPSDLVMCRKQSGIAIGRLCDKCDGKCPVCDSYVRPTTLVRICDECSFGNYQNKCVVCGGEGISDAFYCFECTRLEKDRDGCPKIINLGSSRTDLFYQKKNFRNH